MNFKTSNFIDHSYSRNVSFAFMVGFLGIILGSTSTALLVASSVVVIFFNNQISTIEILRETVLTIKRIPIVSIFPIFYFFVVFTSFRGDNWLKDAIFVAGSYWQFLIMIPTSIGLYHLSKNVNFAGLFSYGCRIGLVFVVPLSLIQIYFFNARPNGFLSNSLIFASLCIIGAGFAIIEWPEDNKKSRFFSWTVFAAGMLAAILTFSRGMLISIVAILIITAVYQFNSNSRYKLGLKKAAILLTGTFSILIASINTENGWRIINSRILEPITNYNNGEPSDLSVNQRLDMQITGFYVFLNNPIIGRGIQNAVSEANSRSEEILGRTTEYTYTHLHNDYLTHAVGGGIALLLLFFMVLICPILLCWSLRKNEGDIAIFYFSLMTSISYSTIALTNIVFRNDQLTTMFCVSCMFLIIRRLQIIEGIKKTKIPNYNTIGNGINPIKLKFKGKSNFN